MLSIVIIKKTHTHTKNRPEFAVSPFKTRDKLSLGARLRNGFSQFSVINNLVLVPGLWSVSKSGLRILRFELSSGLCLLSTVCPQARVITLT